MDAITNKTCAGTYQINRTWTATDACGNATSGVQYLTVKDVIAPVITCPGTVYATTTPGSCGANVTLNATATDKCRIPTITYSPASGSFFNTGTTLVTATATDSCGNSSTCNFYVVVSDNEVPVVTCSPDTLILTTNGTVSNTVNDMATASDNCYVNSFYASKTYFTTADVGNNVITVTASDAYSNTSTCQSNVYVIEPAPVALCKNATLYLDAAGSATLTASDIDNGSYSLVGISGRTVTQTAFNCSHVGTNTVTLVVENSFGSKDSCTATVAVIDNIAPVALAQNVTVSLDASGNGSTTAAAVDNGSSDACGVASLALSKTAFDCSNVGAYTVTLTVTDNNGNVSSTAATVTVVDNVAPIALAQNVTVSLDATGNG